MVSDPRPPRKGVGSGLRQFAPGATADSTLAHDLANHLTAISGLAQVGRLIKSAEAKDAYMVRIESAVQDMANVLRTALSARPADARRQSSGLEATLLVEDVLSYHQPRFAANGVDLCWLPGRALPACRLAPMAVKQAVAHLVDNALRATPRGGRVTVWLTACSRPPGILIRVQDTGRGIPKHLLSLVSAPGHVVRADGCGLGLPVAREIIESLHGGRLSLHSREGHGTTAIAFLPA